MEKEKLTLGEQISDSVAKFGGSWTFILTSGSIIFLWVFINTLPDSPIHWDQYPFILLNLFLSLIAAFQAPFIMMSQRRVEIKQDAAYRGLFAEIKNELRNINKVLQDLTFVLKDLRQITLHQSETIEVLEEELNNLTDN